MTKPFSKKLYDENNFLVVNTVAEFLEQRGNTVFYPTKEYYKSHDFSFLNQKGDLCKIEVERKKVWVQSGVWEGWDTVDIPYRKSESKADFFCMVNLHCDTLLIIPFSKILESPVRVKSTVYTKNEKFFAVPIDQFLLFTKKDKVWE